LQRVVEGVVNSLMGDLKKYCMDSLFNSNGVRQVLISELGSYKSLCLTGIFRVLEQDFKDQLIALFPECSTDCSKTIAGLLVSLLFGATSKEQDDDEDLDDSQENAEKNDTSWFNRVLVQLRPVSDEDQAMITWLIEQRMTKKEFADKFIPKMLQPLVSYGKRQFQDNIRQDNYLLILQYFHQFNLKCGRVVQLLGLQPSTAASFTLVNTYILAQLICGYKNLLESAGADTKAVYGFLETENASQDSVGAAGANNYRFYIPNDLLKSDSRKQGGKRKRSKVIFGSFVERIKFNYQFWVAHPDFVWQVVFPGLYKDVLSKCTNK
ncbi:hypothetical protein MP638_002671, partial [Amoeboaphelidium occidentale]